MGELDLEKTLSCYYCSSIIQKKDCHSHWDGDLHYVVSKCNCGKEHWTKVDLSGFNPGGLFQKSRLVVSTQKKVSSD